MNRPFIIKALIPFLLITSGDVFAQTKIVLGWAEKVKIYPTDTVIHAKLDTGSDYSSLNASDIEEFNKEKQKWVRFTLLNRYGHRVVLEREIKRFAMIKRHGTKNQRRAVIRLGICAGTTYMEEDVNLVDRSKFEYQMLVGRSFLAGVATIDPAVTFTSEPDCKEVPKH